MLCVAYRGIAAESYLSSDSTRSGETITLDGRSLSIEQIVAVARHGARVQLSAEARQA